MSAQPNMFSVLRNRDFLLLETNAFFSTLAAEIVSVAMLWRLYEMTNEAWVITWIGLVQFLPTPLLVLFTGTFADRYSRKHIVSICMAVEFIAVFGIALTSGAGAVQVWPILAFLCVLGAGRAFLAPASRALAPTLVSRDQIGAAISCSTAVWQFCSIAGPAIGGVLYGFSPSLAYGTALVMVVLAGISPLFISHVAQKPMQEERVIDALLGGIRYMKAEKIVLGATTLDLFAVLLGASIGLLPIFVKDVLVADAQEMGFLRAAMGIGALAMALYLGVRPVRRHGGAIMFATVAVFGAATIVFALSKSIALSVAALIVMGASDMISVYIREVLMQLWTPDALRGRVNAANSVLVSASNELGMARAGTVAQHFGAVPAAVVGGICTLMVTLLWMYWFPKLRKADDLSGDNMADEA